MAKLHFWTLTFILGFKLVPSFKKLQVGLYSIDVNISSSFPSYFHVAPPKLSMRVFFVSHVDVLNGNLIIVILIT